MPAFAKDWKWATIIPIIAGFMLQTAVLIWWVSAWTTSMDSRVSYIERSLAARDNLGDRTTRLEALMEGLQAGTRRIEDKLDRLIESRRYPPN